MTDNRREQYNQTKQDYPEACREIYDMLCKGYTVAEITPNINSKYNCDKRTTRKWIRSILKDIGDAQRDNQENYGMNLGLAIERLLTIYYKSLENGKEQIALQALKQVMDLQGIKETGSPQSNKGTQQNKDEDGEDLSDLSTEELKKLLEGEKNV